MKESTVVAFLAGTIRVDHLVRELVSSEERLDGVSTEVSVEEMGTDFLITRDMTLHLCDSALAGTLPPHALKLLAFVIVTSDRFTWGADEIVGEILYDWSCPEVNYSLTAESLVLFRSWLDGTVPYPAKEAPLNALPGTLLSRLIRKRV